MGVQLPSARQGVGRVAGWGTGLALIGAALIGEFLVWGGDATLRGGGELPWGLVVAGATLAYAPLMARRESPWLAFGSAWTFSVVVTVAVPSYEPFVGVLLGLFAVARRAPSRQARAALLAVGTPFAMSTYEAASWSGPPAVSDLAVIGGFWAMVAIGVWFAGRVLHRAARQSREHAAQVAAAQEAARRAERVGIARELHDIVAHALSGIVVQAAGARAIHAAVPGTPEPVGRALRDIESAGAEAMRELHRLLGLLREAGLAEERVGAHRLAEVDALVDRVRAVGLDARVTVTGAPVRLDASVEHAAYRVVQECLSNAMKHAGRGARADVDLAWGSRGVRIRVHSRPAGPGGAPDAVAREANARDADAHDAAAGRPLELPPDLAGGHGLAGLRERVHLAGGTFDASAEGDGFVTTAALPARSVGHEPGAALAASAGVGGREGSS